MGGISDKIRPDAQNIKIPNGRRRLTAGDLSGSAAVNSVCVLRRN